MAVAAVIGGASPDFNSFYSEVNRLAKKLSNASPRELNDPGQTLKLTIVDSSVVPAQSQDYDLFMKPYYDKQNEAINYELFYKDSNNQQIPITNMTTDPVSKKILDQRFILPTIANTSYKINGQPILVNNQLVVDNEQGRIVFNPNTTGNYDPTNSSVASGGNNLPIGTLKLDGATGLDVGLINDRISQVNLAIEALNKVLIVGSGNVQTSVDLRL